MTARMVVHRSLHGEPMLSARPPSDLDKLVSAPISRLGLFDPPSAEQQRRCALVVAGRARDADDARLLLDVLGIPDAAGDAGPTSGTEEELWLRF